MRNLLIITAVAGVAYYVHKRRKGTQVVADAVASQPIEPATFNATEFDFDEIIATDTAATSSSSASTTGKVDTSQPSTEVKETISEPIEIARAEFAQFMETGAENSFQPQNGEIEL